MLLTPGRALAYATQHSPWTTVERACTPDATGSQGKGACGARRDASGCGRAGTVFVARHASGPAGVVQRCPGVHAVHGGSKPGKKRTVAVYILPQPRKAEGGGHKRCRQMGAVFEGKRRPAAVFGRLTMSYAAGSSIIRSSAPRSFGVPSSVVILKRALGHGISSVSHAMP